MLSISYYYGDEPLIRHVNVSPHIPLAIIVDKNSGVSVCPSIQGFKPIEGVAHTVDELLDDVSKHGVNMVEFDTPNGKVYLNISTSTPTWFTSQPSHSSRTMDIAYCGKRYSVYGNKDEVIEKIENNIAAQSKV